MSDNMEADMEAKEGVEMEAETDIETELKQIGRLNWGSKWMLKQRQKLIFNSDMKAKVGVETKAVIKANMETAQKLKQMLNKGQNGCQFGGGGQIKAEIEILSPVI